MPLIQMQNRDWRRGAAAIALLAAGGLFARLPAQQLQPPPDFSQPAVAKAAEDVSAAWTAWLGADKGMEQRIFRMPMTEARDVLQHSLGVFLDFVDKRRAYAASVVAYLERARTEPRPGPTPVALPAVYQDQIQALGASLTTLQQRLEGLRGFSEWAAILQAVQPERGRALQMRTVLRAAIPADLSIRSTRSPAAVSILAYRDSERQLADQIERLWKQYYNALEAAVEQKPAGSVALVPLRSGAQGNAPPPDVPPAGSAAPAPSPSPFAGVWTYAQGSQKFNGVEEPQEVLLELWVENGRLMGRYRATLPDFGGTKRVDLRLQGPIAAANAPQTLDFESKDPAAAGKIVLEGPAGMELMLVRVVPAESAIPRGRELLQRR
jgi:hypothetical protein